MRWREDDFTDTVDAAAAFERDQSTDYDPDLPDLSDIPAYEVTEADLLRHRRRGLIAWWME